MKYCDSRIWCLLFSRVISSFPLQEKRDLITGLKTRTNAGRPNWDKVTNVFSCTYPVYVHSSSIHFTFIFHLLSFSTYFHSTTNETVAEKVMPFSSPSGCLVTCMWGEAAAASGAEKTAAARGLGDKNLFLSPLLTTYTHYSLSITSFLTCTRG